MKLQSVRPKGRVLTVTTRALLARINRPLGHVYETVRKCPHGSRAWGELGDFYLVDYRANSILAKHVNLEDLGRELGVLRDGEAVAS